jgi:hypothetical protein
MPIKYIDTIPGRPSSPKKKKELNFEDTHEGLLGRFVWEPPT